MLTQEGCRARQDRLQERMAAEGIDAVMLTDHRDIYYFTGLLLSSYPAFPFPAAMVLQQSGETWLAAHTVEGEALVDERIEYEFHKLYTMNPDPVRQLNNAVTDRLKKMKGVSRFGWQEESLPALLSHSLENWVGDSALMPIDEVLAELQKSKDTEEAGLLRKSVEVSLAAYDAAQRVIVPGVNELDVLIAGRSAATHTASSVMHHGGDYRSGEQGGVARDRSVPKGELYIIDAHTDFQGYWSDLCRTFSVGDPTDLQVSVYEHIAAILTDVPTLVKPGGKGTELWSILDARIREHPHLADSGLIHHGGHGVGLRPHEAPDLNRDREGIFEVGDVFSCEPGAYSDELGGGVRLENTYWITEDGVENLSEYPMNLIPKS